MTHDAIDLRLIDDWQRDFPLVARPYALMADLLGLSETHVLERLDALLKARVITRIGAVVRPNTAGASTLAAMRVPDADIESVAALVNMEAGVNHNYQREHAYNLWFVATATDANALAALLVRVEGATGHQVVSLPLKRAHHIDLGFALGRGRCLARRDAARGGGAAIIEADDDDRRLLAAIEDGLPLVSRPFLAIGMILGWSEQQVLARLSRLIDGGVISRFGCVVRHRELGFTANAMAVWDIDASKVDEIGERFAARPFVTLCYQRHRHLPQWRYNLYCMVHGRDRQVVREQIASLDDEAGSLARAHDVLFSTRCFKQRGARFSNTAAEAAGGFGKRGAASGAGREALHA